MAPHASANLPSASLSWPGRNTPMVLPTERGDKGSRSYQLSLLASCVLIHRLLWHSCLLGSVYRRLHDFSLSELFSSRAILRIFRTSRETTARYSHRSRTSHLSPRANFVEINCSSTSTGISPTTPHTPWLPRTVGQVLPVDPCTDTLPLEKFESIA